MDENVLGYPLHLIIVISTINEDRPETAICKAYFIENFRVTLRNHVSHIDTTFAVCFQISIAKMK